MLRKGILPILFAVVISFAGTRLVACAGPAWPSDEERRFLDAYRTSVTAGASEEQFAHADKLYVEALQVLSETYVEQIDRVAFVDNSIAMLGDLESDDTSPIGVVGAVLDDSLHDLDPHSAYMTDDMFRRLQESTEGSFAGVGIVIALDDEKRIRIVSPIDDTPAARAGLRPDDRITHIDGYQMVGEPISEAVRRMRGRVGDPVTLTIQRVEDSFDVTVKRARIEVPSVTASIIDQDIGYIRVSRFDATTLDQTQEYLQELEDRIASPRGIIVDLRRNPGGLLDSAADIADQFLTEGLIVATEGRGERKLRSYEADRSDFFENVPMAILLDRGSASGAELMAAALRENGRGIIIGERSFGKGSMQRIMPLTSGGGLKITTGYYTTPENHIVQGHGVIPDIEITLADAEEFEREIDLEHALPSRRRDPRQSLATLEATSCEQDIDIERLGKSSRENLEENLAESEGEKPLRDSVLECAVGYFDKGPLANYRNQMEPLLRAGL
ncbi:S41 family peptidase [Thalassospira sp. ER-Se-21-Dark]|uniref:S41 family peptidase n=1 Tax=Thalassospira sp. ER-Se-21-Dark TaxID=2585190 RepID=UPI001FF07E6D|nr:S41 family peptidase [Thalassospira sp. ER-Se-21-Dark]